MSVMIYRGYAARIEFDAEDELFVGRIAGINDVIGFHAETTQGLKIAFHDAVEGYLDLCAKLGKEPERVYSGKLMLRVKPELHQQLAVRSQVSGRSINQIGEEALAAFVRRGWNAPMSDR